LLLEVKFVEQRGDRSAALSGKVQREESLLHGNNPVGPEG